MLKLQQTPDDEGMITDQEEENKRDMQRLLVIKEETPLEHQEDIKEEEKLWISQQGEQLQQLEETDLTKFGFTVILVKSESDDDDDDDDESPSQLHQSHNDDITEAEPVASSSSVHRTLTAEDDGEDDGGPQPARNSGPNSHLEPDTSDRSSDSSGTETDDSYDWKQTRELQSHFNCPKNTNVVSSGNNDVKEFKDSLHGSGHINKSEQNEGSKTNRKPFCCSDPSKRQKDTLNKQIQIQTGQKTFDCSECGQCFGLKSTLKRHMIIHTGQKAFVCSECGQRFGLKSTLNTHMIIHTGEKAFVCSECGQRFGQKSNLIKHMIIHTGEKPFVCSECGQRFGLKSNLNRHMIIHTGEKLFACSECGQRFGLKSTLKRHMIIHTGQKHFVCSECGQKFGLKSNLNKHMMIHTGQKQFVCSVCAQRFGLKSNLNRHMIIHTGHTSCNV